MLVLVLVFVLILIFLKSSLLTHWQLIPRDGGPKHFEAPWRILKMWGMSRCRPRETGMFIGV